jgi:TatD DNase family protein
MRLVDTHCHLNFPDFENDLDEVIERAENSGVERIIVPGIDIPGSRRAVELAGKYPGVFAAVGIHPHSADKVSADDIEELRRMVTGGERIVAIGEIGLDNYRKYSDPGKQRDLFSGCIDLAREMDIPVIVHCRQAEKDVLEILKSRKSDFLKGVVHCFSGGADFLKEILDLGFFVSFAGSITYPGASEQRKVASLVPSERLLLETDSPYITAQPKRGKRNEPAFIKYLALAYSDMFGISAEEIAENTSRNADSLFRLALAERGTISYKIRDSLYINLTHRCTNRCGFCARDVSDHVRGHNLRLGREPDAREIISEIGDPTGYDEIVFCGFGEPTLRSGVIKKVAAYVKENGGRVRLTTNGEGDLISGRNLPLELKGLVDRVSISLNAPDARTHNRICSPVFGEAAFEAVILFIKECRQQGIDVEVTCLDFIGEDAVKSCRKIAENNGARFRLRYLDVVG